MPDPTEQIILSQTLLPPSSLPTIISLEAFKALFPPSHRDNPQIIALYRNLQHQRNLDLDHVADNVAREVRAGEIHKRELTKARWRDAKGNPNMTGFGANEDFDRRETGIEGLLYTNRGSGEVQGSQRLHTLASIVPALESACETISAETAEVEAECQRLLEQLQMTVGDLSDLRYGKLSRPKFRDEILEGLDELERECDKAGEVSLK